MLFNPKKLHKEQHGQAMIEYAILLILMVFLVVGGSELAISAYSSSKTSDAAKAGANEWADAIAYSVTSNQTTLDNENILELYRQSLRIDTDVNLATRNPNGSLVTAATCDLEPDATCPAINLATAIRPLLDGHCNFTDTFGNFNVDLPIDITSCDTNNSFLNTGLINLLDSLGYAPQFNPANPITEFDTVCTSSRNVNNGNVENIEKIISCRPLSNRFQQRGFVDIYDNATVPPFPQNSCLSGSPPCPDGIDDDNAIDTTDDFDVDDDGLESNNNNEAVATQTACDAGTPPCPNGVIDLQGSPVYDFYSFRGDVNGDGVLNDTDRTDRNGDTLINSDDDDIFNADALGAGNLNPTGNEAGRDQTQCNPGPAPCPDGIVDLRGARVKNGLPDNPVVIDDLDPSFTRLLINKALGGINIPPIKQGVQTSTGVANFISLGNHNNLAAFRRPSCSATVNGNILDYDDGLPTDGAIYLFNPLPIDISNCVGTDNLRGGRSRESILVGGYNDDPTPNAGTDLNYIGLPEINQAMHAQYTKICATNNVGEIRFARDAQGNMASLGKCAANGGSIWLKPPGKMCGAQGTNPLNEFCPGVGDLRGATGYYLLGRRRDGNNELFTPQVPLINANAAFRPTFQIVCGTASQQNTLHDAAGACVAEGAGSFSLQVHTRYRSVYESFMTFGVEPISDINYLPYFYNPNKVGILGNQLIGIGGSEIGPIGANGIPTIKNYKDFRGCYRVDINAPDSLGEQVKTSVSACN